MPSTCGISFGTNSLSTIGLISQDTLLSHIYTLALDYSWGLEIGICSRGGGRKLITIIVLGGQ